MKMIMTRLGLGFSCDKAMKVMQSYLDGETDEKTARKIAKHLESCPDCDKESEVYKKIKIALAKPHVEVSPEILNSLSVFTKDLAKSSSD